MRYFIGLPAALLLWMTAMVGCVSERPITIELDPDVRVPEKSVVIFFADGLDKYRLLELVEQGQLPHIRETFIEGGVGIDYAMSSMPSITYPNCSAMITGRFPGHHDILGNFWFDRYSLQCRYYMTYPTYRTVNEHLAVPTVYDMLADHFTLNIQGHTRRGVTQTIDNENMFAWAWVTGRYIHADRYVGVCMEEAAQMANIVKRWPTVLMTYYPGVDEVGHRFGPSSQEYTLALQNIDGVVGRVTKAMADAGLADSTYYVLIADHGMAPVEADRQLDLIDWLKREKKMKVRTTPIDEPEYFKRYKIMQGYDAVANVDAGRVAMVHLRGPMDWSERPRPVAVEAWLRTRPAVLDQPAVGAALYRLGRNRVVALTRQGRAVIERRTADEGIKTYRVAEYEGDPLGYRANPHVMAMIEAGWHASREWLRATCRLEFPDFVPQVVEMFDSPRTADVVLLAADGWSLYCGEMAGHGSISQRDMRIPMYFTGRQLPRGTTLPQARLVDLVPTVLGLLDEAQRLDYYPPIDGIDLSSELKSAQEK